MQSQDQKDLPEWAKAIGDPEADLDSLHRQALEEIKARGESPEGIMRAFHQSIARLKAKRPPKPIDLALGRKQSAADVAHMASELARLRYFEAPVYAGSPVPSDAPRERGTELSDLFGAAKVEGMFFTRVSGWSMRDSHLKDGDVVLVDPDARIRDGDIVLANVAGHGQVVKRLRLADGERAILESANPDFPPIVITDPDELRIQGKVLGRAGRM